MPHAWKAGAQILLLRRQLEAMEDGGVVVTSVPANPYRRSPDPYERACLTACYLKTGKPRSKVPLPDSKDSFSQQYLFQPAWNDLYPEMIEWVPFSQGGKVTSVEAAPGTSSTSPRDGDAGLRKQEARCAEAGFRAATTGIFG